jgi:hypothetical protein
MSVNLDKASAFERLNIIINRFKNTSQWHIRQDKIKLFIDYLKESKEGTDLVCQLSVILTNDPSRCETQINILRDMERIMKDIVCVAGLRTQIITYYDTVLKDLKN